jgi:hypothetical protein
MTNFFCLIFYLLYLGASDLAKAQTVCPFLNAQNYKHYKSIELKSNLAEHSINTPAPLFPTVLDGTLNTSMFNIRDFVDDFNGTELNKTLWNIQVGPWKGGISLAENVQVVNGSLRLVQDKNKQGNFTEGRIYSKVFVGRGFFETRLRIPVGSGWHQGFYLSGLNFYDPPFINQEIDFFEINTGNPTYWTSTLQAWSNGTEYNRRSKSLISWKHNYFVWNMTQSYNTIGALWTENELRIYYNGYLFLKTPWPSNLTCTNPGNILLTTVILPTKTHPFDPISLGTYLSVDYVAHYILPEQKSVSYCTL